MFPTVLALFPLLYLCCEVNTNDVSTLGRVISDIITSLKWKDTVLLYDISLPQHTKQSMTSYLSDRLVATITLPVNTSHPDVIVSTISVIYNSSVTSLVVCLEPAATKSFLERAKQSRLFDHSYQWLLVSTESQLPVIQRLLTCTFCQVAVLLDVTTNSSNQTTCCSMENVTMTGTNNSEIGPLMETRTPEKYVVCSYESDSDSFQQVASWTAVSQLEIVHHDFFTDFTYNLKGRKLRLAVWESLPFTKRLSIDGGVVTYGGFCLRILQEMARYLNFGYELMEPPDGQYGAPDDNGSWNGMVGMLVRGEVDMAVGPFSITPERLVVIDFTMPFMEDGGGILTKGGDPNPDLLNLFRPFRLAVWLLVSAAVVVTTIVLFTVSALSNVCRYLPYQQPWSLEECFWIIYGSLVSQGAYRHPVSLSGRVVLGCWWIFTIIVVSIYTASLASLLTVRGQAHSVNSIQDLALSSLTPLTIVGSSWWTLFTKAETGVYATVGRRMADSPLVRVNEDAMPLVHAGTAAYILDVNQISYLFRQDCQRLHMAATIFNTNGLGFALPKHARYREAVNRAILKMQEGGFLEAWKRKWWKTSSGCDHESSTVTQALPLPVLSIGGILVFYGCVTALCVLCVLWQCLLNSPCCQAVLGYWVMGPLCPGEDQQQTN